MDTNHCCFSGYLKSGLDSFETDSRIYRSLVVWVRMEIPTGPAELPVTALLPPPMEAAAGALSAFDTVRLEGRLWLTKRSGHEVREPVVIASVLERTGALTTARNDPPPR